MPQHGRPSDAITAHIEHVVVALNAWLNQPVDLSGANQVTLGKRLFDATSHTIRGLTLVLRKKGLSENAKQIQQCIDAAREYLDTLMPSIGQPGAVLSPSEILSCIDQPSPSPIDYVFHELNDLRSGNLQLKFADFLASKHTATFAPNGTKIPKEFRDKDGKPIGPLVGSAAKIARVFVGKSDGDRHKMKERLLKLHASGQVFVCLSGQRTVSVYFLRTEDFDRCNAALRRGTSR